MYIRILIFFIAISASLQGSPKVLLFAGSTRTQSYNKRLIAETAQLARQLGATVTVIDLKDYPIAFYDRDLEVTAGMPFHARQIRKMMLESNVIFISTPEYNASVPAVLKNVLDWASRSEEGGFSKDAFLRKFVVMSVSTGRSGGRRAADHLQLIVQDLGGTTLGRAFMVPSAGYAFDESGKLKDPKVLMELKQLVKEACAL